MFDLTKVEWSDLRCQFGTSSWGGVRYMPMAFTEQDVAMLLKPIPALFASSCG